MGPLLQLLASPPSPDPWGLGGSMHPVLSPGSAPALLGRLTDVSMGSRRQMPHRAGSLSRGGLVHPGGCGRGDQSWETPCPAMEGLELFGSQQAAMAPALGDLPPALKW